MMKTSKYSVSGLAGPLSPSSQNLKHKPSIYSQQKKQQPMAGKTLSTYNSIKNLHHEVKSLFVDPA